MPAAHLPPTGTCELTTVGRRTGRSRRVETWFVVVDGQVVLTGTPGRRHWLANLRERPCAVLHLREPDRDVPVTAHEVTDGAGRLRIAEEARRLRPWYADQPYSVTQWVRASPMVVLTPVPPPPYPRDPPDAPPR